ncbi:MAG: VOC family protein [Deinococcota bacterium]
MTVNLDHLVIGAQTLEQGVTYVQNALGVEIPKGGEHPLMGTHNHLMQVGEGVFLEIIAINPTASTPDRPRWYGLDDPFVRAQLARSPKLLTWVVNTSDISDSINTTQAKTGVSFGEAVSLQRGNLNWQFGIPDDGRLLAGGLLPYLIEWQTDHHPAADMPDLGCKFMELTLYHPYAAWLTNILEVLGARHLVTVEPIDAAKTPFFEAMFETPKGVVSLLSSLE